MAELIPDIIPEERRPLEGPADFLDEDEFDDEFDDDDFEEKIK